MVSSEIKEYLKGPLTRLLDYLVEEVRHIATNRILEYQTEEYNRNYRTKTFIHRGEPQKLYDIYTPLSIGLRDKSSYSEISFHKVNTNSIRSIFQVVDSKLITIIGSAGSGKSTLLKHLFVSSIDTGFGIPVKVELRHLNTYSGTLIDYIEDEIFKFRGISTVKHVTDRMLYSGNFILFLDGFDEALKEKKINLAKEIEDISKKFPGTHIIITSRPYSNIDMLASFVNLSVLPLSNDEIKKFVQMQLPVSAKELTNRMIVEIESVENESYKSLITNPLLLSMFILTFQNYSKIPEKKSTFYHQVFETLFSTHDSISKLGFTREKESGLSKSQFEMVLRLVAVHAFFKQEYEFTPQRLDTILNALKQKYTEIQFDNDRLISDLQVAIGLLLKDGINYKFPHLSLQEYFAASYVSNLTEQNKERFYKKLAHKISVNPSNGQLTNFLSLTYELDEISFLKFLVSSMLREILDQEMIKNGMIINISYQLGHLSEIGVLMKLDYDLIRRTSIKNLKEDYSIDIDEIIRVELQRISELLLRLSDSQEEWMGFL